MLPGSILDTSLAKKGEIFTLKVKQRRPMVELVWLTVKPTK
jgi:hypothetical protein